MFQKFKPLGSNIWIKRIEENTKTSGGLFIPDSAKEEAQKGKILSTGLEVKYVKEGDIVFFGKYSGTKAGEKYLVLKEEDVLGIIEI